MLSLLLEELTELRTSDALRKSRVILNGKGKRCLSAQLNTRKNDRRELCTRGIKRGRKPSWAGSENE
jgi:hypothetical protein